MDKKEIQKGQQWVIYHKKKWWKCHLPFRYMEYDFPGDISNFEELDLSKLTKLDIERICKLQRLPHRCFDGKSRKQAKMCDIRHVGELDEHMRPLSYAEYLEVLRYLKEPYKLIIKLLWFANDKISHGNFVSLESILTLKPCDVQIDEIVNITSLGFHMSNSKTALYFIHYLPNNLALEFREYFDKNFNSPFLFIFSDEMGGPLSSQTVSMAIKRSAERANVTREKIINGKKVLQPIRALHFRRNYRPGPKK